jgi:hypothetical protein
MVNKNNSLTALRPSAILCAGVLCSFFAGCQSKREPYPQVPPQDGRPLLLVRRTPSNQRAISNHGLLVAVWADGRVIRATAETAIGVSYVQGRVDEKQLSVVRDFIETNRALLEERKPLIIDAASEHLVYCGDHGTIVCDETVCQGTWPYGGITALSKLRTLLMELQLRDTAPADFSGPVPNEWLIRKR